MFDHRGFSLVELLIVVAVIAVLTAVAIPVFTHQLEKSREAADIANVRSACGALLVSWVNDPKPGSVDVPAQQRISGWAIGQSQAVITVAEGEHAGVLEIPWHSDQYTVRITAAGTLDIQ